TNIQSASINKLGQSGAGDAACGTALCLSGVGQTRLSGLSVSPDNSKIAVVGAGAGTGAETGGKRVIVYDYTPGNTAGAGASLANGRESAQVLAGLTQGTAWKDISTVLAFDALNNGVSAQHLHEVNATTMVATTVGPSFTIGASGSNVTALLYNPAI